MLPSVRRLPLYLIAASVFTLSIFSIKPAFTANSTVAGTASATIVGALAITAVGNPVLDFGSFAPGNANGTVTVSAVANNRTSSGVTLLGTSFQPALFHVTGGTAGANAYYSLPASVTVSLPGTVNRMTVDLISAYPPTLPDGTAYVAVGGTLHVAANQAAGSYVSAPFEVSAYY